MQPLPDLLPLLHDVRWALVGGLALRTYMPERMTLNVGILIHERDALVVRAIFVAAGYRVIGQLSIGGFTVQMPDSEAMPIDVPTRADPWIDDALAQPVYESAGFPVLSRPYLVLICRPVVHKISPMYSVFWRKHPQRNAPRSALLWKHLALNLSKISTRS